MLQQRPELTHHCSATRGEKDGLVDGLLEQRFPLRVVLIDKSLLCLCDSNINLRAIPFCLAYFLEGNSNNTSVGELVPRQSDETGDVVHSPVDKCISPINGVDPGAKLVVGHF